MVKNIEEVKSIEIHVMIVSDKLSKQINQMRLKEAKYMNAYDEYMKEVVKPMRAELVNVGFKELMTADMVNEHMAEAKGTSLVVIIGFVDVHWISDCGFEALAMQNNLNIL
jgi:hypothetical protein